MPDAFPCLHAASCLPFPFSRVGSRGSVTDWHACVEVSEATRRGRRAEPFLCDWAFQRLNYSPLAYARICGT